MKTDAGESISLFKIEEKWNRKRMENIKWEPIGETSKWLKKWNKRRKMRQEENEEY